MNYILQNIYKHTNNLLTDDRDVMLFMALPSLLQRKTNIKKGVTDVYHPSYHL